MDILLPALNVIIKYNFKYLEKHQKYIILLSKIPNHLGDP